MITSIQASNVNEYRTLFEEAADILSGYKKIRTFIGTKDENENEIVYYKKDVNATEADKVYLPVTDITDLGSFADKLQANNGVLYLRIGPCQENFDPVYGITSLEEYFSWLKILTNPENVDEEEKLSRRKYTVLPLDEEHFVINANTRAINIPAEFKKNGLAVQGDHLAEIVYFEIDRYFDYMDLNNCEIFIQWEAPGKNANGEIIKGVSRAYVRDIESKPGKLIFGWAISDVITEIAGNLKLSVRFFEWNDPANAETGTDKSLAYSFSTLVATVAIQKSINLDISSTDDLLIDDAGATLISRIEDSPVVGGYQAKAPEFIVDMDKNEYTFLKTRVNDKGEEETYIECDLDEESLMRILHVHAFAPDTGAITYIWKYQTLNDQNTTEEQPIEATPVNEMVDITSERATSRIILGASETLYDTTADDFKAYNWNLYIKASDKNETDPIYTLYTGNLPPQEGVDSLGDDNKLYERQSSYKVQGPGVYWAVASNRVTNNSKSAASMKAYFLRPEDVIIDTQPQATGNILTDNDNDGFYDCQLSVVAREQDCNVKTYTWEYCNKEGQGLPADEDYKPISDKELVDGENSANASIKVKSPGYYRVKVRNDRNNDKDGKTLMSEPARVTYQAEEPIFEMNATRFSTGTLASIAPKIIIDDSVKSDKYIVQWYHYVEDKDERYPIGEKIILAEGVYELTFNPLDHAEYIKSISGGDIDGFYYAVVTNDWNGSTTASATEEKPVPIEDMFVII